MDDIEWESFRQEIQSETRKAIAEEERSRRLVALWKPNELKRQIDLRGYANVLDEVPQLSETANRPLVTQVEKSWREIRRTVTMYGGLFGVALLLVALGTYLHWDQRTFGIPLGLLIGTNTGSWWHILKIERPQFEEARV